MPTGINADPDLDSPAQKWRARNILQFFLAYAAEVPLFVPWLDVGAGETFMRQQLRQMFGRLTTSEHNLDESPYPFTDQAFRTITSFEVLEHLFNPLFHLHDLHRLLHRDGDFFLTTPNDHSLIYKAEHLLSRKYTPHFHQFSERDLRTICELAGFRIVCCRSFFRSASGTLARLSRNGLFIHCRGGVR